MEETLRTIEGFFKSGRLRQLKKHGIQKEVAAPIPDSGFRRSGILRHSTGAACSLSFHDMDE